VRILQGLRWREAVLGAGYTGKSTTNLTRCQLLILWYCGGTVLANPQYPLVRTGNVTSVPVVLSPSSSSVPVVLIGNPTANEAIQE
jgi:hypothetical protein